MPKKISKAIQNSSSINQTKKAVQSKKQMKKNKISQKKKQQQSDLQQNNDIEQDNIKQIKQSDSGSEQDSENSHDQQNQSDEDDDQNDESQEQSSQQELAPENYAIKQMKFRQRRGTKMNYLMNRKKQQQQDPFWQNQGQDYFGTLQNQQEDQSYQQSSSGRDQFDSDFDQSQSKHSQGQNKQEQVVVDEDKKKQKKKQQDLMRQIGARPIKKSTLKTNASSNRKNQSDKKPIPQVTNRYIHQVCTQQQLLGQAAQTQYINWLSLQKLIQYENEKKDFTLKEHFVEGQKIIYRDRIDENGKRCSSYELVGVQINKIQDLTEYMNKEDDNQ